MSGEWRSRSPDIPQGRTHDVTDAVSGHSRPDRAREQNRRFRSGTGDKGEVRFPTTRRYFILVAMSGGHAEPPRAAELRSIIERSTWLVDLLDTVRKARAPQGWIGAGVIRDVVWGQRFCGPAAKAEAKDVDVAFFDERDLSRDLDRLVERELTRRRPDVAWDAKNQAAVHLWYPDRFGVRVPAFASVPEAVATWPEFAVCVAARLSSPGMIEICAPHGLDDLLDGVWRRNPTRVTVDEYIRRLTRKQPASRWPGVRVVR